MSRPAKLPRRPRAEVATPLTKVPEPHRWVFWDVDAEALDTAVAADYILPRVLEFGGIAEVRWVLATYGLTGIHRFLRDVGHPELSERTLGFWRAALNAKEEAWARPPAWRKSSAAPWID
jgi:squalene cyclase